MNSIAAQMMIKARTALVLDAPFYGQLALRLRMQEAPQIPTLAVDGKTIYYNPEFVEKLGHDLTKSAIGHEVLHCAFGHITRRDGREPRRWNQAGDYVINAVLKDSGFKIGDGWLYNQAFADKTSDEIYNCLPPTGEDDGKDPLDEMVEGASDGDEDGAEGAELDWKVATIQAANAAKEVGNLPGALSRFVDELTKPKVDWRDTLRRFVTEISRNDYSWMRPNRRFMAQGIYLPGLFSESMGEIAVAIDTSGSITQEMLNMFGAEIRAITDTVRPTKTHIIYCDTDVNHVDVFEQNDELKFDMHGGGGTDFRPPFEYLNQNNITPSCFIYLTDLDGPVGDAPAFPTMWACTTNNVAPWGDTLRIGD